MKLRKLKKIKQEQQGWPDKTVIKSDYGYSTFWHSNGSEYTDSPTKFVHTKMCVITWKNKAWRGL